MEQARQSARSADLARVRYREGLTDFLDLLDAERTQLSAESAVAQVEAGVFVSVVDVYKALGGVTAPVKDPRPHADARLRANPRHVAGPADEFLQSTRDAKPTRRSRSGRRHRLRSATRAEPIAVRYPEGLVHGFLVLRTLDGRTSRRRRSQSGGERRAGHGAADLSIPRRLGARRDGGLHAARAFPAGELPAGAEGPVVSATARDVDRRRHGAGATCATPTTKVSTKTESERMELPADLANGLVSTLLKNVRPEAPPCSLSYVAATPKPRLVKLEIATAAPDRFSTGRRGRLATHYVVKVEIGGLGGLHRAAGRQAAAGLARVDSGRRRAGVREGRAGALRSAARCGGSS